MRVVDDEGNAPHDNGNGAPAAAQPKPKAGEPGYRSPSDRKLEASINTVYEGLGMGVTAIGLQLGDNGIMGTGIKVTESSGMVASAWMDVAEQNKKVKDALVKFTEASRVGTLIGCHLAMMLPILVDRGVVPGAVAAMGTDPRTQ